MTRNKLNLMSVLSVFVIIGAAMAFSSPTSAQENCYTAQYSTKSCAKGDRQCIIRTQAAFDQCRARNQRAEQAKAKKRSKKTSKVTRE